MPLGVDTNLKEMVVSSTLFGPREVQQIRDAIAADFANYRQLRDAVHELESAQSTSPAAATKLGVCYFLLGRYRLADDMLRSADGGAMAQFYLGKTYSARGQYDEAVKSFQEAAKAGYDRDDCALAQADAQRAAGSATEALATLDRLSALSSRRPIISISAAQPSRPSAATLKRSLPCTSGPWKPNSRHPGALFGLALENDRRGNDETALELYQRSAAQFPAHIGSLLNLGILYEDRQQYERARQCYQRILESYPSHPRARLFFRDAQAAGDMFYDEDAQRRRDRLSQVLTMPVTDFELSVRSRNCLQKMGLMTLGDLARTSEQELLASKNFGETSLVEIKEMLASKGLELGQLAAEKHTLRGGYEPEIMSPDEQALLSKSIADLNLSVRARKCMIRLGISTIGELVRRTGDELLECKNFGVTSLNEVREKLTGHALKLRGD